LQQAKDYAGILGLKFAYATNGLGIVEFDFATGLEREIVAFPTPGELWRRLCGREKLVSDQADRLLTPSYHLSGKSPRYYQVIAINRAVQAILQGKPRILLTMATGTGKTVVAFQVCWKLWTSRWNREGTHRRPRILYLSDRSILIDDPKDKVFAPFGDARWKIENGVAQKGREMYFAIYQAIARDERRPGLYRDYSPDFFDLIVVDECHRGSASDTSNWREILEYFEPAFQLGMTATPLRRDNADTYRYFGQPIYTYSLRQGIEDGFLAPYRVRRIITTWDAAGWRPSKGDLDRYGREIPDEEYHTADFERVVALRARTEAVATHLTEFLKATDRFAKTIVFCVDQEHADEMRRALNNRSADLVREHSDYVCRVTAAEGEIGRGHLSNFQDLERQTPVILTTSQMLTTGVDAPTVQNIVLVRVINSMTEFKQIIGRGTRVRDDYGKFYFNILDYTGAATRMFADPDFDGDPSIETEQHIDERGRPTGREEVLSPELDLPLVERVAQPAEIYEGGDTERRKFYFDGGQVEIASHLVYELDPDGKQLQVVQFTDYTADKVRILFRNAAELRGEWADPTRRREIIERLAERGIDFDDLARAAQQPDADPLDLLCHLAFNAPLRTRRERAERLRRDTKEFFAQYGSEARRILDELLDKYTEHGAAQFVLPDVLEVPPISAHGTVIDIAGHFGGERRLVDAVNQLQTLLYAA
ncbi:MAG: DEAD/DEAH box helicase family protein, partial [Acidobacteria bacterium]|nr:DEAD/DEAH box helicase family protein [Acidobacteriota bacterium]